MYICLKIIDNKIVIMDYKEMMLANVIERIDKIIVKINNGIESYSHIKILRSKDIITFYHLSSLFIFLERLTKLYTIVLE